VFEIKAYECEHCGKISRHKSSIKRHEKRCYHNEETRSCITCWKLEAGKCELCKEKLRTGCPDWESLQEAIDAQEWTTPAR